MTKEADEPNRIRESCSKDYVAANRKSCSVGTQAVFLLWWINAYRMSPRHAVTRPKMAYKYLNNLRTGIPWSSEHNENRSADFFRQDECRMERKVKRWNLRAVMIPETMEKFHGYERATFKARRGIFVVTKSKHTAQNSHRLPRSTQTFSIWNRQRRLNFTD